MDLLDELENLAGLAHMANQAENNTDNQAYDLSIQRLENLFQPSSYVQGIPQSTSPQPPTKPTTPQYPNHASKTSYLVKLEGPLRTASQIQHLTGLLHPPPTHQGVGETGQTAHFCLINGITKNSLISALSHSEQGKAFKPTLIRINRAQKDLSSCSAAPTLGLDIDPTRPQFRAPAPNHTYLPTQTQHPVWYFFYGTLADPGTLRLKLSLSEQPVLSRAVVRGGVIRMWGGKYKALIDGAESAVVEGWAYEIMSEEEEDQLRYYETDQYEVVRCEIDMMNWEGGRIKGLTFRFCGDGVD
ncbi:hypothetical protein P170DRAFT_437899 [Aspergillus steynii IBT 23096]|uniref:Putative gamma-glutamylcyclotransferase n=1 Tax=Aspergillus steynii IBT 23096 TaxID=1392250 RepID=A0A2I2G5V9_9EURO|nr:uncharacterized protein P170DRAFT_437899 [Aspergillus steynii IBT 23096]PLB48233.1 hypothetical protein P170DRAFT_437899 [Aspergillus steynii IBT 23096]